MTTTISISLGDEGSIDAAIQSLDMWVVGKLNPVVDTVTRMAAVDTQMSMYDAAHVKTGNLKNEILTGLSRNGEAKYRITVDPVNVSANTGNMSHYAGIEASRGMDHDFTRNVQTVALLSAGQAWSMERSKL